ncbi:MAG: AAA family ATPase [Hallella sp.]|uniref:ATP-binding protein n=1 Tax=Hallella sp. TaxID=2980186 RepID=UPI0028510465|nr:AAA family ATPase [Hallella sp.]MDR4000509.1 AAA family ATPase [Hallella sp.]MED9946377.1 AAA family ATPase [Hallella sp.]
MTRKLYPIGIQTFSEIRTNDNLYIDKTAYIYRMANSDGKYFFLSRPRRFGKSLLVSTLLSYFGGRKELFKGLAIDNLENEWAEYPVLHFDLSGGKHQEEDQLNRYLDFILKDNERRFGVECDAVDANVRLANLIASVYKKTGKQVVVLIDEYDAPLLDVVHQDERLESLRHLMRNFYSPLKQCEPMLRFVFLTGITKFSQLSIFSELNNITNISMDEAYAGICGITKEELLTQMSDDIDRLAEKLSITREVAIQQLKDNYDGYHFTYPSPDIFNPYSLLNCFSKEKIGAYWFGSGTPTFLIEMMRKFGTTPMDIGESEMADVSDFDAPTETMESIVPLLYQSGYVTIKDYDEDTNLYELGIPNKEIRIGLFKSLLPNYLTRSSQRGKVAIAQMSVLIKNGDIDGALELFRTFLATVPYCENTKYEGHFQQLMYVVFALLTDYRILVEQRTSKGRTDITLETQDSIYIMELKFGNTADEALAQINANHYADAFAMSNKKTIKVGIGFDVKDERNITEWKVER